MPCDDSRAQQEEDILLFFLGKGSANEKPGLFAYNTLPHFLFPSIKVVSFPCHMGTCTWLAILKPKLQFSADPK